MNTKIREAQKEALKLFAKKAKSFALSGGTALELYYLHHRFSADLDFFSPRYDITEIEEVASEFKKYSNGRIKLESEFTAGNRAKIRFYTLPIKDSNRPLKIDFVEDVLFKDPTVIKIEGIPVYSVENIYLQKIIAITGTQSGEDEIGRQITQGRRETRDAFDIYTLSKKIQPLHIFLKGVSAQIQRGMAHWYRTFSRHDLKLALLDLDIYDKKFSARDMVIHLEEEIKKFIKEVLNES